MDLLIQFLVSENIVINKNFQGQNIEQTNILICKHIFAVPFIVFISMRFDHDKITHILVPFLVNYELK